MGVQSVWTHYGYASTPYSTSALGLHQADEKLLVGREAELAVVLRYLASDVQLVAIEGNYGVGKSSLAAVATSQAAKWKDVRGNRAWFLPGVRALELQENDTADSFEKRAYSEIAGAILAEESRLLAHGFKLQQTTAFRRWLTSPEASSWSAGIGASVPEMLSLNVSGARSKAFNTGAGFTDTGVVALVDSWLTELFPSVDHGGVILRLDNLESLAKFPGQVNLFETLRDRLFKRLGLRWIVSGAEGMVRSALSTPKMSGMFPDPIELGPINPTQVPEVIERRAKVLAVRAGVLPVSPAAFEEVYLATGQNLRFALGLADRYALQSDPGKVMWMKDADRRDAFWGYVLAEGNKASDQLSKKVGPAAWKVLEVLVRDMSGVAIPGQFEQFGYRTMTSLLHQLPALSDAGLVDYTTDTEDSRRRLIAATNNGRLLVASRLSM